MSNRKFHFGNAGAAGRKESSANASRNASGSSSGAPGSAPNRFASFNSRSSKPPAPTLNAFTFRRAGPAPFATPSVPRGRPLSDQETFGAHRPTTPGPRLSTTPPFRGSCTADGSSNANHGRGSKELADGMLSLSGKDTQDFGGDYIRPNERHVNSRSNSRSDDEVENEDEHVRSSYDSFMYSEQDSDAEEPFNMEDALASISDAYSRKANDVKRYKHRLKSYMSRIERLEEKARDLEDHVAETKEAMEKCEEEKNGLQEKMSAQKTEYLSALDDVSTLTKRASVVRAGRRLESQAFNNILLQKQDDISKHAGRVQQKEEELSYLQGKLLDEVEAKQSFERDLRRMRKKVDDMKQKNQLSAREFAKEKESLESKNANTHQQLKDAKQSLELEVAKVQSASSVSDTLQHKLKENEIRTVALQADLKKKSCQEEALKKENELLKEDARKRNEEYEEEIRQVNETKNCLQLRLLEETQSKDQLRSDLTLKNEALQNRVVAAQDHGTEAQASLNQEIKKKDDESRRLQSQLDKLRGESSQKLQAKENELRGRQEELKKVREQVRLRESEMKSLRSQVEDAVRMEKLADKKRKAELAISGELRSAVKTTAQEMDTVKTALAEMGHKLQPAFEQLANVHGQLEARLSNEAPASGVPATEKEHFKAVLQNVQEGVRALVAENSSIKEDLKRKGLENQEATRVAHEQVMERLTVQQSLEEIEKKVSTLEAEKRRLEEQLDSGKNNKTTLIARLQQDKRLVDTAFDNLDVSFPAAEKKSSGMQKEPEHAKGSGQMLSPAPLEDDDLPPNPKPRKRLKKLSPPQKASKDTGGPSKRQKQPSLVRRKKRRSAASVPVGDSRKNNRRPSPDDDQDMFDDDQKMSNPQSDR